MKFILLIIFIVIWVGVIKESEFFDEIDDGVMRWDHVAMYGGTFVVALLLFNWWLAIIFTSILMLTNFN